MIGRSIVEASKLKDILDRHRRWLAKEEGGELADLQGADLRKANLRGANLRWANLRRANLQEADLRGADLWRANLQGADLRGADLRGADLRAADLQRANLWRADLRGANLQEADLRVANIDYLCLPLWCGSFEAILDLEQKRQIAVHLLKFAGDGLPSDVVSSLTNFCREAKLLGGHRIIKHKMR